MRDVIITLIVIGSIPAIFMRPYIGILMWSWIGYMNPHRLSWGFAYDFPFALLIAAVTIVSFVFYRGGKRIPIDGLTITYFAFFAWILLTTIFALNSAPAQDLLIKIIKIQLVVILTMVLIKNKHQVNLLIWVIVASIGFFGIKGGFFTITSGGAARVWGPSGSYIEGNNELAIALLMVLPLFRYLITQVEKRFIKWGLAVCMVLIAFSVLGSFSRGAMLAGFAMAVIFWFKSNNKFYSGIAIISTLAVILAFAPSHWYERMDTIQTYDEDDSAMSRINAWKLAVNVAVERPIGGGLNMWSRSVYEAYGGNADIWQGPHSIYFQILGEHGFVGLLLFLSIYIGVLVRCSKLIRITKENKNMKWVGELCKGIQVGVVAYLVGGAFLGLAYFDLPWHFVSIVIILSYLVQKDNENKNYAE